jgi:hypothetical protein
MTAKVHKKPWKTRPIVCCSGTFATDWRKWLYYWFQQLKLASKCWTRLNLSTYHPKPRSFLLAMQIITTSTPSMQYKVITWWLCDLESTNRLPMGFPLDAVLEAMVVIMKNNIFKFGTCYFLQLVGTATGTSAAIMWATLYFVYHEVHTLIPNHGQHFFYFKSFIDDMFGVWIGNATTHWSAFCNGILLES